MIDAPLCLDGVDVHVAGTPIVHGVDLDVPSGTVTTMVGPSGAGKTTVLRAIAGLADVTAGRVLVAGRDVTRLPAARRDVAVVFQEPRLFPHLDVADNVAFALRVGGTRRSLRRARATELLDRVGLAGFEERGVRQLSGGEQQRVNLARALAAEPAVLLLDEPLAAVDPTRRAELRELLRDLHRDFDVTALHVTHDLDEAAELGDRIAVVLDGHVVQHAPVTDVFTAPCDPVVAALTGNPNLLRGHVVDGALRMPGGELPVAGPDGAVTATVRPEHLRPDPDGTLRGLVVDVRYRGSHTAVRVDVGGVELLCRTTATTLPDVGDRLGLAVAPEHVHRFPDSAPVAMHREPVRAEDP